jgi:hypothetical protein
LVIVALLLALGQWAIASHTHPARVWGFFSQY